MCVTELEQNSPGLTTADTDSDTAELCPGLCPNQILGVAKIVFCMK